jgi:hypothetical protein
LSLEFKTINRQRELCNVSNARISAIRPNSVISRTIVSNVLGSTTLDFAPRMLHTQLGVQTLREKDVEVSHARQIKRNIVEDCMRVVTLLLMWVITVPKRPNINNLKQLTGILNFVIRIQDYKSSDRIMQCFKCQNFGHKAEFCHIKDRCVKCAGEHNTRLCTKDAAHPARCANCGGQHSANYQGCPEAQKYNERRGTTRTPSKPQAVRKPNFASKVEFPELPRRQKVQQSAPELSVGGGMEDFREILDLFRSGTISSYIGKFKGLMQRVKAQPDSMSKMLTFGLGLVEIFDD